jgi:hypothetical protein
MILYATGNTPSKQPTPPEDKIVKDVMLFFAVLPLGVQHTPV